MRVEDSVLKDVENDDIKILQTDPEKFWDGVKIIGRKAFCNNSQLTRIVIPEGIIKICDGAFAYCKKLESVILPSDLKVIGSFAFWGCEKLESLTIPNGIERIGENFFNNCKGFKVLTFEDINSVPGGIKSILEPLNFKSYRISDKQISFFREIDKEREQNSRDFYLL